MADHRLNTMYNGRQKIYSSFLEDEVLSIDWRLHPWVPEKDVYTRLSQVVAKYGEPGIVKISNPDEVLFYGAHCAESDFIYSTLVNFGSESEKFVRTGEIDICIKDKDINVSCDENCSDFTSILMRMTMQYLIDNRLERSLSKQYDKLSK